MIKNIAGQWFETEHIVKSASIATKTESVLTWVSNIAKLNRLAKTCRLCESESECVLTF